MNSLPFRSQFLRVAKDTADSVSVFLMPALYALFKQSNFSPLGKDHSAPSSRPWPEREWRTLSGLMSYHGGSSIIKGLTVDPSALWLTLTLGSALLGKIQPSEPSCQGIWSKAVPGSRVSCGEESPWC